MPFMLGTDVLTCSDLADLVSKKKEYDISPEALERCQSFRSIVDSTLASGKVVYGINTGFGLLSDVRIQNDSLVELQENLVRSHACGVGSYVSDEASRALLFVRLHTFLLGHSGVSVDCINSLRKFIDHEVYPLIPVKGSVGASGDLAPLAHLALCLIGEGKVRYKGEELETKEVLKKLQIEPLSLKAKEGLSLINGTHFMASWGAQLVVDSFNLLACANIISMMSLDGIRGTTKAYDERIHSVRPQKGQGVIANFLLSLMKDDPILNSHSSCDKVQDPYSFRCIPQVHGATLDTLEYVESVFKTELNSVTDNPLVFENGDIISGGNFHGQPVAMALDFLCISVSELGSISERRIEKLTNPALSGGLPPFVTKDSGLNSGYMIPHVVSAALVSENKVLCHPASVDSIPTSADKEDHVSMGPIAAKKASEVIKNVSQILAIELLTSCQAIDLLHPLKPSEPLKMLHEHVRRFAKFAEKDTSLHEDIKKVTNFIDSGKLVALFSEAGYNYRH